MQRIVQVSAITPNLPVAHAVNTYRKKYLSAPFTH